MGSLSAKINKDLMKAEYYYNHLDFHEAIPFYEKVADSMRDAGTYARVGDCYRFTGNLQKSADWYAKAVKLPGRKDQVSLHYAQVLMQLTRYEEAEKWLKDYQKTNKADKRAANLIAGCEASRMMEGSIPSGFVTMADFNTNGSEFAPTLWRGNLVFTSDTVISIKKKKDNWSGGAYLNIYSVACDQNGKCAGEWSEVTKSKNINIKYHDGPCTFSADGSQMYFTRSRYSTGFLSSKSVANSDSVVVLEIMIASGYDSVDKEFKTVTPFKYNSKDYSVAHPSVSPNGNMLVFSSNMQGGAGGSDIYLSTKNSYGEWSRPENMGAAINTEGEEVFPYLADDTTLFFSSDGHIGMGGLDIYRARWNTAKHTFTAPENVGAPINSSFDDISLALYADGRSSWFSSNRPAARGGDNIYYYKREKVFLKLIVKDSVTGQPLPDVTVALKSVKESRDAMVDKTGGLITPVYPEAVYSAEISKPEYSTKQLSFSTASVKEMDTVTEYVVMYRKVQPRVDTPTMPVPVARFTDVAKPELNTVYEIGYVPFDYDKYAIIPNAKPTLDSLSDFMKTHPTLRIEVRAHTDCREKVQGYNMELSQKRAKSVMDYLHRKGISLSRLTANGLGATEPRVPCPICEKCTESQHYQNRIMDFKVVKL